MKEDLQQAINLLKDHIICKLQESILKENTADIKFWNDCLYQLKQMEINCFEKL